MSGAWGVCACGVCTQRGSVFTLMPNHSLSSLPHLAIFLWYPLPTQCPWGVRPHGAARPSSPSSLRPRFFLCGSCLGLAWPQLWSCSAPGQSLPRPHCLAGGSGDPVQGVVSNEGTESARESESGLTPPASSLQALPFLQPGTPSCSRCPHTPHPDAGRPNQPVIPEPSKKFRVTSPVKLQPRRSS